MPVIKKLAGKNLEMSMFRSYVLDKSDSLPSDGVQYIEFEIYDKVSNMMTVLGFGACQVNM